MEENGRKTLRSAALTGDKKKTAGTVKFRLNSYSILGEELLLVVVSARTTVATTTWATVTATTL